MQDKEFIHGLLDFIKKSPTPFHAVQSMVALLEAAGFLRLNEKELWDVKGKTSGESYFVTRNDSSIVAFSLNQPVLEYGFSMLGAHTDSPCLKVKPNPEIVSHHYLQLGVEVYGGALLNPWFDRDLSLAGRVSFLDENQTVQSCLIDFEKAVATIPSLAIHLDRDANVKRSINKQKDLPPVLMQLPDRDVSFNGLLLQVLQTQMPLGAAKAVKILGHELSFYDVQAPAVIGVQDDFIASARLDNLLSCYVGLMALIDHEGGQNALLVCHDHEEVGSVSAAGAQGTFLKSVLLRLCDQQEDFSRMIASSMMVSVDNAHAVHPNFSDKHDSNHGPIINEGPVIKINANQRYASNSETSALFQHDCDKAGVPVQSFVVRSDMACGSTIGPISASELGVSTVDVGVPTFAMHSIRELAGSKDVGYLYRVLLQYFN
ncbi:MAG: M18 family aminopeptidase [Mariprofundaceae bacterium]